MGSNRRSFLKNIALGSGAIAATPVMAHSCSQISSNR